MPNLYSCWSGFDFKRSFIQTQKRNLDVLSTLMDLVDGQKIADAEGISLKPILIGAEALKNALKNVAYLLTGYTRAAASSLFDR